jgi:translation initiation factor 2 subunit 2
MEQLFELPQKKKKKKIIKPSSPIQCETDYSYHDLLKRAYVLIDEMNNNLPTTKLKLPKLMLYKRGHKTIWSNFHEVCKLLNREIEHVIIYFSYELKTQINSNDDHCVIQGIFTIYQIENIIINYVKNYVVCKNCNDLKTELFKRERLCYIKCNQCLSVKTIEKIKK